MHSPGFEVFAGKLPKPVQDPAIHSAPRGQTACFDLTDHRRENRHLQRFHRGFDEFRHHCRYTQTARLGHNATQGIATMLAFDLCKRYAAALRQESAQKFLIRLRKTVARRHRADGKVINPKPVAFRVFGDSRPSRYVLDCPCGLN